MKRIICIIVVCCCLFASVLWQETVFAHTGPDESGPIIIGAIFSLTGIAALNNRPLVEMIEVTVDWINNEGGVLGRQLELRVFDNKSTPIGALQAAHKAVDAHVTAVIGAHWSSHSLAIAPVLQKAGIPMISPASTHPDVTLQKDFIFRITFVDSVQGKAMARFAVNQLEAKRTAILRNIDEQYCNTLADYYRAAFLQQGGDVVVDYGYRGDSTDFSAVAGKLVARQPDVIYVPGYTRDTALIMKQLRQNGITGIFLGGDGWDMLETLVPEAVDGSYQSVQWHPDVPYRKSAVVREMYEQYMERDIQNMTTPLAYDAVMVLVAAIRKASGTDRLKIRNILAQMKDFSGATGPITFNENGDPEGKDVIILKYNNGSKIFDSVVKQ